MKMRVHPLDCIQCNIRAKMARCVSLSLVFVDTRSETDVVKNKIYAIKNVRKR